LPLPPPVNPNESTIQMANFPPLKRYILYCLDRLIDGYDLADPFLDVGCGIGDVALHLSRRGWRGKAIDRSEQAVQRARQVLQNTGTIEVEHHSLETEQGCYSTVIAMDVLEHIPDDVSALNEIHRVLIPGGYLILGVPSNPREWRWDDEFYGHCRRYSRKDLDEKLAQNGFESVVYWDFTYPVFWLMRRLYTRWKRPIPFDPDAQSRTQASSMQSAWESGRVSMLLGRDLFLWRWIYGLQFHCFRNSIHRGHEMLALARKVHAGSPPRIAAR
jgi:SAM-dependent methyltransferase